MSPNGLLFVLFVVRKMFEVFFLQWAVIQETGLSTVDHYLDDFIFAGGSLSSDYERLMTAFTELKKVRVPLAENKTVGPTNVVKCLGFVIDTVLMMIRIPQEKIDKLKLLLQPLLHKKKINVKQLESLTGLMAFYSEALPSARAFRRSTCVCKSEEVCYFPEKEWVYNKTLRLFTDSTGNENLGCRAYAEENGHS